MTQIFVSENWYSHPTYWNYSLKVAPHKPPGGGGLQATEKRVEKREKGDKESGGKVLLIL